MGTVGTVDLVARDRATGSAVLLSSVGVPTDERIRLLGVLHIQSSRDEPNPWQIPGAVEILAAGEPVRPDGLGLEKRRALSGSYDVYEGVVGQDAGSEGADVFVTSDPVEWAVVAAGLAVCLILRAPDIWLAKKVLDGYEKEGCVANYKVSTSWRSAITCSFSLELEAVNIRTGEVVHKETIEVGGKEDRDELDRMDSGRLWMFQHLKRKGVQDPNVDFWIAVLQGDDTALKAAVDAGADVNATDSDVLAAHQQELSDFNPDDWR
jgi:hypothetical protein